MRSPEALRLVDLALAVEDAHALIERSQARQDAILAVQQAQLPSAQPAEPQTLHTRPIDPRDWELTHWERHGRWYMAAGVVSVLGLVGWMVRSFVQWLNAATASMGNALSAAVPTLLGIGALALLAMLCCRGGGGGRGFSGTFEGWMH
ncbi:MAG: hypothetical protein ACRDRO_06345 [Pseudonocardiaceae bacterium]